MIPDEDDAGHDNASDLDSKLAMMSRGDVRRFSWVTSTSLRRQRIRRQAIISAISLSGMGECCSLSAELFDGSRSTIVFRSIVTSTSARFLDTRDCDVYLYANGPLLDRSTSTLFLD